MSEEQLSALLAKLKDDKRLLEKLKGAADLDAAVAMAQEADFEVSKEDWLRHQAQQTLKLELTDEDDLELTDEQLTDVAGGKGQSLNVASQPLGANPIPLRQK